MPSNKEQKLLLEYPCPWVYKIIGTDEDEMQRAVAGIIRDRNYGMSLSRTSAKAKYQCFDVKLTVESEGHRTEIYDALKAHPAVKIVL